MVPENEAKKWRWVWGCKGVGEEVDGDAKEMQEEREIFEMC